MPKVGGKKFPYTKSGMNMAKTEAVNTGQPLVKGYEQGGTVIANAEHGKVVDTIKQGHKGYTKKVTWT